MRVLVCGGRDFKDYYWLFTELDRIHHTRWIDAIIHGGANGADTLAGKYANERRIHEAVFSADWQKHGRAAGPIRNQQILEDGKPDLVVAFPGGRGTEDMIRKAEAAGIAIQRIS